MALQLALSTALALRISKVFPLVFLLGQELEISLAPDLACLLAFYLATQLELFMDLELEIWKVSQF